MEHSGDNQNGKKMGEGGGQISLDKGEGSVAWVPFMCQHGFPPAIEPGQVQVNSLWIMGIT